MVASLVAACVSLACAEEYWIAYEGNDFPENEGWTRIWNGPPATRWIEDGTLVIDSRPVFSTAEWYEWYPSVTTPQPGEYFVTQWGLKIDDVIGGSRSLTVGVFGEDRWAVGFDLDESTIRSAFEPGVSAQFEPGEFHDFELRSADMRAYELFIDGSLAIEGSFWLSLMSSVVNWGDGATSSASFSRWDYFRFGIVPEPDTGIMVSVTLAAWLILCRGRR